MPLPVLFIGAAAISSGVFGAGKTVKAVVDNSKAKAINEIANESVRKAEEKLENQRSAVSFALNELGELKLNILQNSVTEFLNTFEQIKNVDFTESTGLEELANLHIDVQDFKELRELGNFAINIAGGASAGAVGGALTAFGAYSAAMTFASASTGTAISTLSGAAATNATLAFFGGGSLAAGGYGMVGGMMVLGSMVVGPALMVMGLITGAKSHEKLNQALENKVAADETTEALNTMSFKCSAIRRRTYMFYELLSSLDAYFLPLVWKMEDIVNKEGTDYRQYSAESKKTIASAASAACSIKAVLDTPILTEDGALTPESEQITNRIEELIYKS